MAELTILGLTLAAIFPVSFVVGYWWQSRWSSAAIFAVAVVMALFQLLGGGELALLAVGVAAVGVVAAALAWFGADWAQARRARRAVRRG